MSRLDDTIQAKKEKRASLEKLGVTIHPYSFDKKQSVMECREMEGQQVKTAGRIMSWRTHGKVVFLDLQDSTGRIQVLLHGDNLGERFAQLSFIDMGDFLGVWGEVSTTKTGEITIKATGFEFHGKALRPLPTAWNVSEDKEVRFRKRYIDLLVNPEAKRVLDARWLILKEIRRYLEDVHDFVEVETPVLQSLYGGTNATPFTTYMKALDTDFYLRLAPELYLKRLIAGGYERIFEIARNFRNEGIDQTHQPEFTMIEWYHAYADYHTMMDTAEGLIRHLVGKLNGTSKLQVQDIEVDLAGKWPRITMFEALIKHKNIKFEDLNDDEVQALMAENEIEVIGEFTRGKAMFALFDKLVTPYLIEPTWIIDYPRDVSPLSKKHRHNPELAERFEGYIGGKELADGWSEIVDPIDQRHIFENEQKRMRAGDDEAHPMDEDFIESMEHGLPPLGGIGMGIDRLVMFLTNTWSIKEVIAFPTLRPIRDHEIEPIVRSGGEGAKITKIKAKGVGEGIQSEVYEKFPGIFYAQVFINNVEIKRKSNDLEKAKEKTLMARSGLTIDDISAMDSIKAYRNLFKATGTDWHKKRPSPEALLRRIALNKGLYNINTAVDAYNLAVIETGIGLGGFDADKLNLPINLRFSQAGEKMLLLGDEKETATREGQLIYSDQEKPITIDLNYRDINASKLTKKTKTIALYADGAPGISQAEVVNALQKGADYIQQFCGGEIGAIEIFDENGRKVVREKLDKGGSLPSREESQALVEKYIKNDKLSHHCLMVAQAMEAYAKVLGEDEELWYQTGLLHDLDWEMYPDEHPNRAVNEILADYPSEVLTAIKAHAPGITGQQPEALLDKYLFACDELSGLMHAASLVRPGGFEGMKPKSIKKKMKTKAFAANVSRDDIRRGFELIGKEPNEHIEFLIGIFQ